MFIYLLNIQAENKGEVPITDMTGIDKVDICLQCSCSERCGGGSWFVRAVAGTGHHSQTTAASPADDEDKIR